MIVVMRRSLESIGGDIKPSRLRNGRRHNRRQRHTPGEDESEEIRLSTGDSQIDKLPDTEVLPVAEDVEIRNSVPERKSETVDVDDLTFPSIPEDILRVIESLPKEGDYLNTPAVVFRALKSIGISYEIIERGHPQRDEKTAEVRGDRLALTLNAEDGEFEMGEMTTQQVVKFIKEVAEKQIHTQRLKVIEASLAPKYQQSSNEDEREVEYMGAERASVEIFLDIPEASLNSIESLLKKHGYVNTPRPVLKVLRDAGFSIRKIKVGTLEKTGDLLQVSKGEVFDQTMTTAELVSALQDARKEQKNRRTRSQRNQSSISSETEVLHEDKTSSLLSPTRRRIPPDTEEVVESFEKKTRFPSSISAEDADIISEDKIGTGYYNEVPVDDELLRTRAREASEIRTQILSEEEASHNPIEEHSVMQETQEIPSEPSSDTPAHEEGYAQEPSQEYVFDPDIEVNGQKVNIEQYGNFYPHTNREQTPVPELEKETPRDTPNGESRAERNVDTSPSREKFFDARFAEFGISQEMWESIEGHDRLTPAQQKLVFENLRESSGQPFLKKVWEGIREKLGKEREEKDYLPMLTELVKGAVLYGPKVHEDESTGELFPDFVDVPIPRLRRMEFRKVIDTLNESAHLLAKTPASWREDGIGTHSENESKVMSFIKERLSPSRKRYNEYERIQSGYEQAKQELARELRESGYDATVIATKLVEIDSKVYGLQFQQTSPDAVEAIKDIPDASMWKTIGRSLCRPSNLGYMALGAVGRTALAGALGIFAAPATSALIAGGRAWDRSAAEMRERDRAARMGKRDTSKEALNIVSAEMTITIGNEKREVGVTHKLQALIDEYQVLSQQEGERGETQEYKKEMNTLIDRIKVRAQYVEDKQRLNRISFGSKETHASQMAKLYETLAIAQMIVADRYTFSKSALEEKLNNVLFQRENAIQNKRRLRQAKEVSWNALRAGAFAYAGGRLAEKAQELELGDRLAKMVRPESFRPTIQLEGGIDMLDQDVSSAVIQQSREVIVPETYVIQRGDSLTKILKEQIPEIKSLGAGKAQENAIANILRSLSPEELRTIGIQSGDIQNIRAGDTIHLDLLQESIQSQKGVITSAVERFGTPESVSRGEAMWVNNYYDETTDTPSTGVGTESTSKGYEVFQTTKSRMLETHFTENVFGNEWGSIKTMNAMEFRDNLPKIPQNEYTKSIKELMDTVAKPPMKVVPERGERMEAYLKRAYSAFIKYENVIPQGSTIRKILSDRIRELGS